MERLFMNDNKCKTCGGPTEGYKCDMCGAESQGHDPKHMCGGEHCMQKCKECNEAEVNCICESL